MRKFFYLSVLCSFLLCACNSEKDYKLSSPDGLIEVTVRSASGKTASLLEYSVTFHEREIVQPSSLGFAAAGMEHTGWQIENALCSDMEEDYVLHLGKSDSVHSISRMMVLNLRNKRREKMQLVFRAFNDGIAYRYVWPDSLQSDTLEIEDEFSHFNIVGNPKTTALCFSEYTTAHEGNYTIGGLDSLSADTLIDLPVLFELPDSVWVAITEANLDDYPGMYLSKSKVGKLVSKLSPLPDGSGMKARIKTPHASPWRVLMIGNKPGTLIESNIVLNLSEPCAIDDVSWIKPNKSTWPWWCSTGVPDNAGFKRGMNFETSKYYIDFAAKYGIGCHSLTDVDGDSWYTSPLETYPKPGEGTDVTKPNPKLQMDKLLAYAREKNVRIRLWVHWKALEPKLEEAFALYEKWGIEGLMVDYMDRDDQEMVNFYHRVMESAARHKLHIQFHGAYKPTGLRRTYPNLVTTEGVLNLEFLKWSDKCTPQHNVNVAFTRMLAGPLDYHFGGFRSVLPENFKSDYDHPVVMGTRCHIMGMYVVFESYLQLLCDAPHHYIDQPGFEFLLQVPATWNETKVLSAVPGEYIVIARRSGSDWYVGALNNNTVREVEIPLDFLSSGHYILEEYTDCALTAQNPNELFFRKTQVNKEDCLRFKMAKGGGAAMRIVSNE